MSEFFCGVDLGQSNDPTAVAIVQKLTAATPLQKPTYHLRHLERMQLGTSYPAVVRHVKALLEQPPLAGNVTLVLDYPGVGRPVADAFQEAKLSCPLYAITITGGDTVTSDGRWYRTPKRDLIGVTQVLLQSERLKIATSLPEASTLVKELLNFKVKIDPATAHDSYSAWRENIHDDLVLATALACWFGEHHREVELW